MRIFVSSQEIERVEANVKRSPVLYEVFGKDWIYNDLLTKQKRFQKHALFWLLLDENKSKKLEDWLRILKSTLLNSKFFKVINSFMKKRGKIAFYSYLSEIEVLAYYKNQENNGFLVEFEPHVPGKPKVGDIKLNFNSKDVFIEITRMFPSEEEERINKIMGIIRQRIDEFEDNPYLASFGIKADFRETDIDSFVDFAHRKLLELPQSAQLPLRHSFSIDKREKAWLRVDKKLEDGNGFVDAMLTPILSIESASRLKNKMLDEVEQLPEDHFNVLVIDISHHFTDFDDVEDALAGQLGLRVDKETLKATPFRNANGIMHMEEGKQVGVVIAFKGFDYGSRRKYINLSATLPFSDEMVSRL